MPQIKTFLFVFQLLLLSTFALPDGFSYLTEIDPTIKIQARYAIPQNFVGQKIDGYLQPVVICSTKLAYALKQAQEILQNLGYSLLVYDCYRPQKAVDNMVKWASQPQTNKTKIQFYPYINKEDIIPGGYLATKSGHTRGSTVDLTIFNITKTLKPVTLVDYQLSDGRTIKVRDDGSEFMCGHFDLFDLSSYHDTNLVSAECLAKRNMLRKVLGICGLKPLSEEWWHYTLINESFPDQYFDFDVK